jgi:glutamate synthase domain-containing protein 3
LAKTTISSLTETDIETDTSPAVENELDRHLLAEAQATLEAGTPLHLTLPIDKTDSAVGLQLAIAVAERFGDQGLPEGTVNITFHGNAGPGFGSDNTTGVELTLIGEASDGVGQRMGGGRIVVRPSLKSQLAVSNGVIVGDFALEEAYGGNLFVAGQAGDHFAFRNYGATAVVEGVGDFGCAEMAAGVVVVLGSVASRFAAGMQGGLTFVLDANERLPQKLSSDTLLVERVTDETDVELLNYLITRHVRLTGSIFGQEILDDWLSHISQFWKIRPKIVGPTPLTAAVVSKNVSR